MARICGQLMFISNDRINERKFNRMVESMATHTMYSNQRYIDEKVALGQFQFQPSNIDENDNRTMSYKNYKIVFTGKIYNSEFLKSTLIGHNYELGGGSDQEIVIRYFDLLKEKSFKHLDGVYAIIIWNKESRSMFMIRDVVGIQPLYYHITDECLLVASHSKAIISHPSTSYSMNKSGLQFHLMVHGVVPAPQTILNGLKKLPPGHYLKVNYEGVTQIRKFRTLNTFASSQLSTNFETVNFMKDLLVDAVRKRCVITHQPIGVFLSGGLDSSIIVAILSSLNLKDKIKTYSIGFDDVDNSIGNEFYYSDLVSKFYETKHQKYSIKKEHIIQNVEKMIMAMSEPIICQDAIAFYLLAKNVCHESSTILTGQGADELFGGYQFYNKIINNLDLYEGFQKFYLDRSFEEYKDLVRNEYRTNENYVKSFFEKTDELKSHILDKLLKLELETMAIDGPIKRVEMMTSNWSIDAISPFLDTNIIEFVGQLPLEWRRDKLILKEVAKMLAVPTEVIDREKIAFPVPQMKKIEGELLDKFRKVLFKNKDSGLFNLEKLKEYEKTVELTPIEGNKFGQLAILEMWLKLHDIS
ncbi:hypothetical protein SNEBB_009981 [Seison nebaliae]|nr:hypothetical protein SNEBB_009981 [Seison nebaliae]